MCRLACTNSECCCCLKRNVGAQLIGIFYVCLYFFGIIGPIVELTQFRKNRADTSPTNATDGKVETRTVDHKTVFDIADEQWYTGVGFEEAMIILILALLVGVIVNVIMVWAVQIKNCWLLLPWLGYQILVVLAQFVSPIIAIYCTTYVGQYGLNQYDRRWMVFTALVPIGLGLVGVYFWMVVRALFDDLDKKPARVAANTTMPGLVIKFEGRGQPKVVT